MSISADRLREEGRVKGESKGRVEGALDRTRAIVRKQLTLRFGKLPESVVARIDGAELAQLDIWAERVLTGPTLAEVLDAP